MPLSEINILQATVVKDVGTSVKLSWSQPKDQRKVAWVYGVYYGQTPDETLESKKVFGLKHLDKTLFVEPRYNTTNLTATITKLDACEQYIFTVGIIGPLGAGPVSMNSDVMTYFHKRAPPKKLTVSQGSNQLKMLVQWSASCPHMNEAIGYIVCIFFFTKLTIF